MPFLLNTLNDKWLRIIGITLFMLINVIGNGYFQEPLTGTVLLRLLISFISLTTIWHIARALIFFFRRQYPLKSQLLKRLALTFISGSLVVSLIVWITGITRHWVIFGNFDYNMAGHSASITFNKITIALSVYGFDFIDAALNIIFFQIVYEILFFARDSSFYQKQLRQAEQEQETLRAANLQSQLDALKQQVNPHFLFNSLNVLDSLIEEDPQQARVFLDELSTVYRYLLRSNRSTDRDSNLTDLGTELDFIQSYFHLLKTRHGTGLHLNIVIDNRYEGYQLPPLTLQLLVENAVKHNVVLPDQPLRIDIETDEQAQLRVRNNLQRKTVRVASNGIGLANILSKYQMLNQPPPTIRETDGEFVVTLPLIATSKPLLTRPML